MLGCSVGTVGDIDKDDYDDIIFGGCGKSSKRGAAYIIYGGTSFSSFSLTTTMSHLTRGFMILGKSAGDFLGFSGRTAGDVNNDEYSDIVVGAYGRSSNRGEAYVIYGGERSSFQDIIDLSTTTLTPATNGFTLTGDTGSNNFFGQSVSSAGDMNKDGYDDILIGAYGSVQGKAYVIYGAEKTSLRNFDFSSYTLDIDTTGFTMNGNYVGSRFGFYVSPAGDVNKDGYDDIIVGSLLKGAAYVIHASKCEILRLFNLYFSMPCS